MPEEFRKIDRIIVRYLLNEADTAEQKYLLDWLKEDIANQHHFFAFKDLWEKSKKNLPDIVKTGDSLKAIKQQLNKEKNKKSVPGIQPLILRLLKYAAAVVLLSVLGIAAYILSHRYFKTEATVEYNQIATENGQKKEITLPDGTKVWLNSGTTFKYADNYGKVNREVFLIGEAFFDVTRDESKTFIVKAGELTIKVLGTSFNVNCYPENKVVETTVISGIVSIENDNTNEGSEIVILNKLEKGTYMK
ncbi:MAG TPA: FecR family protein, partial [Bacteroidales bacterium]|nr:FecR family protein [Bacteroidales bacterium]